MAGSKSGGDDFDSTFDFNDMPTPGGPPEPAVPSDDFGGDDFGGDDFGTTAQADLPLPGEPEFDDFGTTETAARPAAVRPATTDDDFDVDFDVEDRSQTAAGDDFDIGGDDRRDEEGQEEVYATDSRSSAGRFVMPAIIGVVLVAAAGFAYLVVLPFMGINLSSAPETPQFVATPIEQPQAPQASGGFDLPPAQTQPPVSTLPVAGSETPTPSLPSATPSLPVATSLPSPSLPNGGGLATPITSQPASVAADSEDLEDLRELVAELRQQVEAQNGRIAELETRPQEPVVPQPVVTPPEKPMVVEGWTLKGVTNGVGWIDGPEGFLEVREGTVIPNVGKVTDVTRYENQWLVITDAGIIVE